MVISQADWDAMIQHAQEDAPNECCGYARMDDGRVAEVFRSKNLRASPYGYEIDPQSLLAANDLDDEGHGVAIYHSHPRSAAGTRLLSSSRARRSGGIAAGSKYTAATTTGPLRAPRPTSSQPITAG